MNAAVSHIEQQHTLPGIEPPPQYQLSTVTEFNATEIALADFRAQFQDLVFNVATPSGLEEAKKARRFLVTARTGLDKRRKELKADIIARGKLIDGEAGRITDQIECLELPIDAQIKKREAEQEEIRLAKLQVEAQRQAAIHQRIEAIRLHGATVTTPLGELQRILARLQAIDITQDVFEEHAPMALLTKTATIEQVQSLITERQNFEAAQAEAKRQQEEAKRAQEAEDQRIAAERQAQAAEQARLDEQQAQFDRERAEFAETRRKAAEEDAKREAIEVARLDAISNALPAAEAFSDMVTPRVEVTPIDDLVNALSRQDVVIGVDFATDFKAEHAAVTLEVGDNHTLYLISLCIEHGLESYPYVTDAFDYLAIKYSTRDLLKLMQS